VITFSLDATKRMAKAIFSKALSAVDPPKFFKREVEIYMLP
jgi:hypothetical protein